MTPIQLFVIAAIAIPLALAVANRIRVDVAALLIAMTLGAAQAFGFGVLGAEGNTSATAEAISGFSRPVVITLISLFIVSRVLDRTGVTNWLARRILVLSGQSEVRVMVLLMLSAAILSLFMNNVAVGALLLPSAIVTSKRTGIKPSKLLMPISFGTLLGGSATYFTTANIIMDTLLQSADPPQAGLSVLAFTPTGGLIAVVGIGFVALFGRRLLPDRPPMAEQMMSLPTGSELEDVYQLGERLWEARVKPWSPLVNQTLAEAQIGQRYGLSVIAIWHGRQAIFYPSAHHHIRADDILVIVGREDRVAQLLDSGLEIGRENNNGHISERGATFVEAILRPHSRAIGQTLKDLNFRKRYAFTAVALLRDGRSYRTDVADFELKRGDAFLLVGSRANLKKLQHSDLFIILETDISDQPLQKRPAAIALMITACAIAVSVLGFPVYLAMLAAAVLMVLLGLISMEDSYRSIEWSVIFLVAGMYSVSLAMTQTGLADTIGSVFVSLASPFGSIGLAAGCFLLSATLTHLMGGQVTALVTGPIAITAALSLNTNPQAIAVATAIGCSAAFLSPIAHPVNMLMVNPGNYRPGDFLRFGLPMMAIMFMGVIIGMVLFWRL